jgi:hypothetical protein
MAAEGVMVWTFIVACVIGGLVDMYVGGER